MTSHHPKRIREFLWDASRAVDSLYCRYGDDAPGPLPLLKGLSERREVARAHKELCGVYNSDGIAGVQLEEALAGGGGPTGTKFRCYISGLGLIGRRDYNKHRFK